MGCIAPVQVPPDPLLVKFSADTLLTHDLQGEMFIRSDSLGMPTDISIGEQFVLIGDPYADQAITVFSRESGDFVAHAAPKGEGAEEISRLRSMNFRPGDDSGWAYAHPGIAKYFDGASLTGATIRLIGEGAPMDPVWVFGDSIISSGIYESGRLGVYSPEGEFIRAIGSLIPGEPSTPVAARQYAYEAILRTNSSGTRIVAASLNTDRLEIFDTSKMVRLIRGPGFHEPVFSVVSADSDGNPRTLIESETIQGYVSMAVTDQFIFALYSGKTRAWVRSQGHFSPPGQTVIVLTWAGEPVGVLELQDGAMQIGVSQNGHYLYAIYRRPLPAVLRYEVPVLYRTAM
ncbi:MAG: BF3164 family lipoprotein [Bacteroidetes bacterium]|nr:BF3164 family lipoprotein [Bacteroidota bacterium]